METAHGPFCVGTARCTGSPPGRSPRGGLGEEFFQAGGEAPGPQVGFNSTVPCAGFRTLGVPFWSPRTRDYGVLYYQIPQICLGNDVGICLGLHSNLESLYSPGYGLLASAISPSFLVWGSNCSPGPTVFHMVWNGFQGKRPWEGLFLDCR